MDEPLGALDSQTCAMMQENLLSMWREFGTLFSFVIHDVGGAIYLSDRVLIVSAGPGRIIADMKINLPCPRSLGTSTSDEYVKLRVDCMEIILKQSLKAFGRQNDELEFIRPPLSQ